MDPIAQMLNEIKNAQAVSKESLSVSFSNFKYELLKILEKFHFIKKVEKKGRGVKRTLEIVLDYEDGLPKISGLKKVSRPSQRVYLGAKKLKATKGGLGIVIVSTPKGLMSAFEARKGNLGGEVIAEVW